MKINPIVYNDNTLYGSWYLEGKGKEQTWLMIEFLKNYIPSYTHQDIYRFLTDSKFRKFIISLAEKNASPEYKKIYRLWTQKYEFQIDKKKWHKETVRIVTNLIDLPDPELLFPSKKEIQVYNAVVNSQQYFIPVIFPRFSDGHFEKYDLFSKDMLIFYFETYGFDFLDFCIIGAGLGNKVPYLELQLQQYHTYEKQVMEIYLPFGELVSLYKFLFQEEYPDDFGVFDCYDLGKKLTTFNN